ncbi:MAG: beta strand repeat-containing protein, partial [Candidatus Spyradenecus sp.]
GANTTMTGVPTGSATSKIKVVGSDLTAIPNNVLAMTGIVEIEPTITLSGDDAKLSFNTAQTLTYSANVNAPRLVVGDSGSANATITQLGGTISLSSTATACDSTTDSAILLGHWNTTTTYNLPAGTLSAPNGALCLGWDGTTTLNVGAATGDAALVNVYALKSGERYNTASVTINPTGTLQVGAGGIGLGSHSAKSVTLAGGTLIATATASANISHANGLNVTAPSTVAAAPSTTLTINKVSGASNLTLGTAGQTGTVVISDVSAYTGTATATTGTLDLHNATFGETLPTFAVASGATLILPADTEGVITVPADATLTLVLSSTQLLTGYTTTVTSGTVTFKKVGSDGALAEITDGDGTIDENGTFTPSLNTWTATTPEEDGSYTWSNAANWSKGTVPAEGDSVKISVSAEGTTLTLGSAVTVANVSIAGEGTLTLAGEALTVSDTAMVSANTTAVKDKFLVGQVSQTEAGETQVTGGTIQIDDGKTLTVSTTATFANVDTFGSSDALALPALTGTGTLVKEGTGDLGLFNRSAEPTIQVKAGTLHVRSVPTTAMKLTAEDGATINFTAWATSFPNSLNTFSLKGGSSFILGNGLNDNQTNTIAGAMTIADATDEKPVKIYGSAFGPVTLNMPISGTGTVEFADGGSFPGNGVYACDKPVTVSGVISGGIKVKVTDQANAVVFSGANAYNGGTDIASGATLKATNSSALGTDAVTGAGTVAYTVIPSSTGATFTGT